MKTFILAALLTVFAFTAIADTPPINNVYLMKAPGGNGAIVSTAGKPALVTSGTTGWVLTWNGSSAAFAAPGAGGVTSVGLLLPSSVFTLSGTPVTSSGTLTGAFATQAANQSFMGPVGGGPATPSFRALVAADIPNLAASKITSGQGSLSTTTDGVTVSGTNAGLAPMTVDVGTASASDPGLLDPSDWSAFNSKQDAIPLDDNGVVLVNSGAVSVFPGANAGDFLSWDGGSWISSTGVSDVSAAAPLISSGGSAPEISLPVATASADGYLALGDWITFNDKQDAGNYITALTGDVTAAGPGSAATTLATVNGNVGSFTNANITVNAKGLVTAASSGSGGSGTVTTVSVASANGFAGSVANATTTPAITVSTSITGVLKGNGTAISAATAGTDYSVGTGSLTTGILKSTTSTGGLSIAVAADFPSLSSIYCAIVGCTLTGAFVDSVAGASSTPAVSLTGAPYSAGNATTNKPQLMVETSGATSTAWSTGGTEVGINAATGFAGDLINILVNAVKRFSVSAAGLITMGNPNNTRQFTVDYSVANLLFAGKVGTNYSFAMADNATGGTGVGWMSIGSSGVDSTPDWPVSFETISADGNVTSLTATAFTPLAGASVNGSPLVVARNRNSTANTLMEWGNTGSSGNLMGGWGTRHVVQTASSEQSDFYIFNRNSGTMQEVLRINQNGNISTLGSAPGTPTSCGTSPAIAGNNNVFKLTVGTGGTANACVVPFASTPVWDNAPSCNCNDETTALHLRLVPTTTQLTINGVGLTTGLAAAFGAGDVIRCTCGGYR